MPRTARRSPRITGAGARVCGPSVRPLRLSRASEARLRLRAIDPEAASRREREQAARRERIARRREDLRAWAAPPDEDLVVTVRGLPRPQGSLDVLPSRATGRLIARHPKGLRRWRGMVRLEARRAIGRRPLFAGPLRLEVLFVLPRPKSLPRRIEMPERKPDLDKLIRAIGDALEGVIYLHDAQITTITGVRKRFGTPARAEIRVGPDLEP
jgi:crossover junction endodeoxyribonuclease RusA